MVNDGRGAPLHDCWNRVGVRGDLSCPLLKDHVHCRNCPVFAAAAAARLDGELPAGYLEGWTEHFAQPEADDDSGARSILVFRIGTEWLALPTSVFREIIDVRPVHALPHRRNGAVLGVVNVRGELVICVGLGKWLGIDVAGERRPDKRRLVQERMAVVSAGADPLVFPVDEVHGTRRFLPREVVQTPATVSRSSGACTKAVVRWQQMSIGLLDDEVLFHALGRSLA